MTGDGEGLVSRGGLVWLGEVADRSGLTAGLSQALAEVPRRRHRQRGRAEQIIRDTKACGLARLPFDSAAKNDRWMQLTVTANDLLCWARRISLTGPLRRATPKTIRHRLLHVAACTSPRRLRLDTSWPWTPHLLNAIKPPQDPPPATTTLRADPAGHPPRALTRLRAIRASPGLALG